MASPARPTVGLSAEPLDPERLAAGVGRASFGAIVTFVGTTRATSPDDPRPVAALEYEAYPDLALREMEAVAAETRARFGPLEIALAHRTGRVEVGEASVVVVVAAPHRAAAFDACRYAIDAVKARVAVWKRELYADGDAAWVANATPDETR